MVLAGSCRASGTQIRSLEISIEARVSPLTHDPGPFLSSVFFSLLLSSLKMSDSNVYAPYVDSLLNTSRCAALRVMAQYLGGKQKSKEDVQFLQRVRALPVWRVFESFQISR